MGFKLFKKKEKKKEEEKKDEADLIEDEPSAIQEPEKPASLNERVALIDEKIDLLTQKHKIKKKPFKLPWSVKSQLKNLAKKNKVLVILLRTNRNIEAKIVKIEQGFIIVDGKVHNISPDFIFLWDGKTPCIVLCEWDLNPIGTEDYYKAVEENRLAEPQTIIIRAMRNVDKLQLGTKISPKMWIIIFVVGIAVAYVLFGKG
jgi:hypothetical protein